ncbi:hypothetical protein HK096_005509, partial [Nowakowskiella sp. JEL0078]
IWDLIYEQISDKNSEDRKKDSDGSRSEPLSTVTTPEDHIKETTTGKKSLSSMFSELKTIFSWDSFVNLQNMVQLKNPSQIIDHGEKPSKIEANVLNNFKAEDATEYVSRFALAPVDMETCSKCKKNPPSKTSNTEQWLPFRLVHVATQHVHISRNLCTSCRAVASQYQAISHSWGQIVTLESKLPWPILIHDANKLMDICHAVTKHNVEWIWMDILCIDQNSPSDKCSQVRDMGHVYSSASAAGIWLTSSEKRSDLSRLIRLTAEVNPNFYEHSWDTCNDACKQMVKAANDVGKDDWFWRIWTLQEYVLPQKLIELESGLELENLHSAFSYGEQHYNDPDKVLKNTQGENRTFWHVAAMLRLRYFKEDLLSLKSLLRVTAWRECSIGQDRIYGLHSFSDVGHVSYDTNIETVTRGAVEQAIRNGDLSPLLVEGSRQKTSGSMWKLVDEKGYYGFVGPMCANVSQADVKLTEQGIFLTVTRHKIEYIERIPDQESVFSYFDWLKIVSSKILRAGGDPLLVIAPNADENQKKALNGLIAKGEIVEETLAEFVHDINEQIGNSLILIRINVDGEVKIILASFIGNNNSEFPTNLVYLEGAYREGLPTYMENSISITEKPREICLLVSDIDESNTFVDDYKSCIMRGWAFQIEIEKCNLSGKKETILLN